VSKHRSRGLSQKEEDSLQFAADIIKSVTDRHRDLPPKLSLLKDHEKITAIRKCGRDCKMKHRQPEWFYTVDGIPAMFIICQTMISRWGEVSAFKPKRPHCAAFIDSMREAASES